MKKQVITKEMLAEYREQAELKTRSREYGEYNEITSGEYNYTEHVMMRLYEDMYKQGKMFQEYNEQEIEITPGVPISTQRKNSVKHEDIYKDYIEKDIDGISYIKRVYNNGDRLKIDLWDYKYIQQCSVRKISNKTGSRVLKVAVHIGGNPIILSNIIMRPIMDMYNKNIDSTLYNEILIDHIDGDPMNNRRSNLRVVDSRYNNWNVYIKDVESIGDYIRDKHRLFLKNTITRKESTYMISGKKVEDMENFIQEYIGRDYTNIMLENDIKGMYARETKKLILAVNGKYIYKGTMYNVKRVDSKKEQVGDSMYKYTFKYSIYKDGQQCSGDIIEVEVYEKTRYRI